MYTHIHIYIYSCLFIHAQYLYTYVRIMVLRYYYNSCAPASHVPKGGIRQDACSSCVCYFLVCLLCVLGGSDKVSTFR